MKLYQILIIVLGSGFCYATSLEINKTSPTTNFKISEAWSDLIDPNANGVVLGGTYNMIKGTYNPDAVVNFSEMYLDDDISVDQSSSRLEQKANMNSSMTSSSNMLAIHAAGESSTSMPGAGASVGMAASSAFENSELNQGIRISVNEMAYGNTYKISDITIDKYIKQEVKDYADKVKNNEASVLDFINRYGNFIVTRVTGKAVARAYLDLFFSDSSSSSSLAIETWGSGGTPFASAKFAGGLETALATNNSDLNVNFNFETIPADNKSTVKEELTDLQKIANDYKTIPTGTSKSDIQNFLTDFKNQSSNTGLAMKEAADGENTNRNIDTTRQNKQQAIYSTDSYIRNLIQRDNINLRSSVSPSELMKGYVPTYIVLTPWYKIKGFEHINFNGSGEFNNRQLTDAYRLLFEQMNLIKKAEFVLGLPEYLISESKNYSIRLELPKIIEMEKNILTDMNNELVKLLNEQIKFYQENNSDSSFELLYKYNNTIKNIKNKHLYSAKEQSFDTWLHKINNYIYDGYLTTILSQDRLAQQRLIHDIDYIEIKYEAEDLKSRLTPEQYDRFRYGHPNAPGARFVFEAYHPDASTPTANTKIQFLLIPRYDDSATFDNYTIFELEDRGEEGTAFGVLGASDSSHENEQRHNALGFCKVSDLEYITDTNGYKSYTCSSRDWIKKQPVSNWYKLSYKEKVYNNQQNQDEICFDNLTFVEGTTNEESIAIKNYLIGPTPDFDWDQYKPSLTIANHDGTLCFRPKIKNDEIVTSNLYRTISYSDFTNSSSLS
ncbi:hypothetical protein LO80_02845 [Candidatus Francisella endociliophora]|uniref:MACPF domain-containing protein n=1 Tax=Candidatus Francisella endociliophora TaxID=653937 RepID=A0A097EN79_9GAMM|nr:hypothetical protein [Francisella sp. FSC1006]AIT09019.1 hypothetical protein LO80_02845 [Francisella sp. FSC1006]